MSESSSPTPSYLDEVGGDRKEILNVRGELAKQRTQITVLVEKAGRTLAHPAFFLALLAGHLGWILLNLPIYPWFAPWDPYPFMFLATIASVEAPFIALLVLMHQQRDQRVSELRGETHLQVSLHTERKVSVALHLLETLQPEDGELPEEQVELLHRMQDDLDPHRLMQEVRRDLHQVEGDSTPASP